MKGKMHWFIRPSSNFIDAKYSPGKSIYESSSETKQLTQELRNFVAKKSRAKDALSKTVDELINSVENNLLELSDLRAR